MSISAISNSQPSANSQYKAPRPKHSGINSVSLTGWGAVASAAGSFAAIKNKSMRWHVNLAYAAAALTVLHAGLVEWFHHKKQ